VEQLQFNHEFQTDHRDAVSHDGGKFGTVNYAQL
jgi:hypothetical protein